MKRRLHITALCLLLGFICSLSTETLGCTTAVISGKFTKNGRPMIWKVRDTEEYDNYVRRYKGPKWEYIGLVNSSDPQGKQVWGGHNERGFAIMNSASFNVNLNDTTKLKDTEGHFMRLALEQCATLREFEALMDATPKPMGLAAHFGVIDAQGGAAFYEVNNYTWTKYDANDPKTAPRGYVLRTNFSETGKENVGYGFIRCQTANLMFDALPIGELTIETVMQEFSRSMIHPILDKNYRVEYAQIKHGRFFVPSDDLISRYGTSSVITVEGVKKGESPELTTSWIQVGFPYTCITLPVWTGCDLPYLLRDREGDHHSILGDDAMKLKEQVYPIGRSDGYHYLLVSDLINKEKTGITQRIEELEDEMFLYLGRMLQDEKHMDKKTFYSLFLPKVKRLYQSLLTEKEEQKEDHK